jgi:hypothetical protein
VNNTRSNNLCSIVGHVDIFEVEIAERALDLEAFPANGIAMGAAGDENHIMAGCRHAPAEISADRPSCHNRNSHLTALRLHSKTVD